jgi:hypothetical protein
MSGSPQKMFVVPPSGGMSSMNSYRLKAELQTRFHCFRASPRDMKAPHRMWDKMPSPTNFLGIDITRKRVKFAKIFSGMSGFINIALLMAPGSLTCLQFA